MLTETLFRSVLVIHKGERYRIVHRSQVEGAEYGSHSRLTPLVAQARVDEWLRGPAGSDLRQLGAELLGWSYSSPRPLNAESQLRGVLRRELEDFSGSLVLVEERATHFQVLVGEEVEVPELEKETEENHWIEIRLVDEENKPVAGVEYEIKFPDKSVHKGRTPNHGVIYFKDLDPGECEFTFSKLDEDTWESA